MRHERLQIRVLGVVQGVGFRPFVYRLATSLGLAGWVRNDETGVTLEAEGPRGTLLELLRRLPRERPSPAVIYALDHRFLEAAGHTGFEIRSSAAGGAPRVWVLPDLATCPDCRREVLDPENRRFGYPFTNCTHCGPRFTIIEALPYDRPRTSMKGFTMCEPCQREYEDPADRRFHAQPNACPTCGPSLRFFTTEEGDVARGAAALRHAVTTLRAGGILAVKGLGGYHIVVDAGKEEAVATLRRRKRRPFKPLAVMYGGLEAVKRHVQVPAFVEPLLDGAQAPIVILPRTAAGETEIAPSVAPASPHLGVFLPTTPLHHLLLAEMGRPLVATSGNRTDQPTLHRDDEAREDLAALCDAFLVHDRPIVRQADDSVLHVLRRPTPRPQMLRRARGYTPLPILAPQELPAVLALGGHMNVTFALSRGREVILSQHLGEMDALEGRMAFRRTLDDFLRLYDVQPEVVAHDLHPGYFTTELAEELGLPRVAVQHHHAHLAACMLENGLEDDVLGLTWDGTGYGEDGTLWGGEILWGGPTRYHRVATLHPFHLPGGDAAIHETWRTALSLLWEVYGDDVPRDLPLFGSIAEQDVDLVLQMLRQDLRSPVTTSMGRLYDGVSALLGLSYFNTHQAQSPQLLEHAAWRHGEIAPEAPFPLNDSEEPFRLDWRELVQWLVDALRDDRTPATLAASFHHAVSAAALRVVQRVDARRIALTGGVFCNRYLTETLLERLEGDGRDAYVHSQLPPTDGGLAAGQLWVAVRR